MGTNPYIKFIDSYFHLRILISLPFKKINLLKVIIIKILLKSCTLYWYYIIIAK